MRVLVLDVTGRVDWSGGQTWAPARLLADHLGRAAVWTAHPHSDGLTLAWSGTVSGVTSQARPGMPGKTGPWHMAAAGGTTLHAAKEGCGCGSRLAVLGEMDLAKLGIAPAQAVS